MSRRWLLLMLLVLLPLRGWAGMVMATEMVAALPMPSTSLARALPVDHATASEECHGDHGATPELSAHRAHIDHGPLEVMAHDSAHDSAQVAAQNPSPTQHDSTSCASCVYCQICHTVALPSPLNGLGLSWASASLPWADLPADLSATPLPSDKPPIV
ncbi:hypothetical protein [Hylemonella gracilis]|uniref:DUF2946 domain-containing protein n=1 Tax=Hylemonella gracilis ATCC 19624 TaxID=887062 RepID=F3KW84_9BURK|nr:hypothetical protein [Hylemonella gracilis]EGI75957.1 hypothetical protein HGR_13609 [Hylemonella gracilis ATCC 19624]